MKSVYIGALSGTSMDALDVAAVRFSPRPEIRVELLACRSEAMPQGLRESIRRLQERNATTLQEAAAEHKALGELFADAVARLIEKDLGGETVRAVGLHGQTVLHRPCAEPPLTLQIGDPNVVAARTGCVTVSDFRRSDLALGGQGAPLAPAFHRAFFGRTGENRTVVNIGGVSNITRLESDGGYSGFDCGPGNILLDLWVRRCRNQAYDRDGAWARSGAYSEPLLTRMLDDPFFRQTPPKSACATDFNIAWLEQKIAQSGAISPEDVQASLVELSARCIADAVNAHLPTPARVLICGGGAHNGYLMERLQTMLKMPVADTHTAALSPDWVEAAGFAYLAQQRLRGEATDLRPVTGARKPAVLGAIYRK